MFEFFESFFKSPTDSLKKRQALQRQTLLNQEQQLISERGEVMTEAIQALSSIQTDELIALNTVKQDVGSAFFVEKGGVEKKSNLELKAIVENLTDLLQGIQEEKFEFVDKRNEYEIQMNIRVLYEQISSLQELLERALKLIHSDNLQFVKK